MNLDEPQAFGELDRAGALDDIEATPQQWERARADAEAVFDVGQHDLGQHDAVVVTGMGGSGIAGDVVAALGRPRLGVPVVVHKGYGLPAFAGPRTLVLAVSASGNTDETLTAAAEAADRGCRVYAVTGGGELADRADAAGWPVCGVPRGISPRHLAGALTVPLLVALGLDGDLGEAYQIQRRFLDRCGRHMPTTDNPAKQLANQLADGRPVVVWGTQGLAAVAAYRLKCQLNENAKLPAFSSELPELDHNEVVGWQEPPDAVSFGGLLVVRDPDGEHPRVTARVEPSMRIARPHVDWVGRIESAGASPTARLASLFLMADLASVYAALAMDRDPTPIPSIDALKAELASA